MGIVSQAIGLFLLCAGPHPGQPPAQEEDRAERAIIALGGRVVRGGNGADGPITAVDLHATNAKDADLAALTPLSGLRDLDLGSTLVTGAGLTRLAKFRELRRLTLRDTPLGVEDVWALVRLKNLEVLDLSWTHIDNDHLKGWRASRSCVSWI